MSFKILDNEKLFSHVKLSIDKVTDAIHVEEVHSIYRGAMLENVVVPIFSFKHNTQRVDRQREK